MADHGITMRERYLAIVLLDLIGSTKFVQKVGAKKSAVWLQYHDRLARSLIYKFQGREIDRSDGFLLSFESIVDAVNFALAYQKEIPPKTRLNTRIGIHWGSVIEIKQEDKFIDAGAKRVELEGIAKNISARTMSLCQAGQVLLTKQSINVFKKHGTNMHTPKGTRFACVGLYKFKGVKEPQEIYAIGTSVEVLQPPPSSDKVKRLGGPRYIKKRARDRKVLDWFYWFTFRFGFLAFLFWVYIFSAYPSFRGVIGLPKEIPFYDSFIEWLVRIINK